MDSYIRLERYIRRQQMGELLKDTIDKTVTLGQSSQTVAFNTVDKTVMLEYSRWDSYIRTQQIEELYQNRVDWTDTIGHNRQDSYIRTQQLESHENTVDWIINGRWDNNVRIQQLGQLHQDTINQRVILEQIRLDSYYRTQQIGQLPQKTVLGQSHQDTVDWIINSRWDNYVRTQQMGQLHQDTIDWRVYQNTVDGTVTIGHNR